jgi:hypothetical protein
MMCFSEPGSSTRFGLPWQRLWVTFDRVNLKYYSSEKVITLLFILSTLSFFVTQLSGTCNMITKASDELLLVTVMKYSVFGAC